ncbi:MAG TPA: glutathione S-transferase family protein [Hyphomonadaceae bacterium]|jgi:glutathione S-transferase|nr:glutathione S-transferase family protein [Hyphomonadaceae bacterium]
MKFYNSIGPNPRVVKMFMAEKGIDIPRVEVDLRAGENRQPAHVARNPSGQMPTLELDDGSYLAEVTAICEYLEELHPTPPLIGASAQERAMTRMWTRRVDLYVVEPMLTGFRSSQGLNFFKDRMRLLPQAADDLKVLAQEKISWLDKLIEGREFIAGPRFTLADILLFCTMDFAATVGQPLNPANANITAWFERIKARPSAAASTK